MATISSPGPRNQQPVASSQPPRLPRLASASKEVSGALRRLRLYASAENVAQGKPPSDWLTPPALVAVGGTGIEARMLNEGIAFMHRVMRGDTKGENLVRDLEAEINTQAALIAQSAPSRVDPRTQSELDAQKLKVAEANEKILKIVSKIDHSQHGNRHPEIKDFAVDCIHRALRKKPWIRGTYRSASTHPIQDLELAPRQAWLLGRKRETANLLAAVAPSGQGPNVPQPSLALDLGITQAQAALSRIREKLQRRPMDDAASLRLSGLGKPTRVRVRWVRRNSWFQRLWDGRSRRRRSREGFIALLKAAGASEATCSQLQSLKDITTLEAKNAVDAVLGAAPAESVDTAIKNAGLQLRGQPLGKGGMGFVVRARQRGTGGDRDVAFKKYDKALQWSFSTNLPRTLARGKGADSAYGANMQHLVVPLGYFVEETSSGVASPGYRYLAAPDLRPYLREQAYHAAVSKRERTVKILGDLQPLAPGATLDRCACQDLTSVQMDAVVTQGVSMLFELDRRGFSHGDIKPANLMLETSGEVGLRLIDTDYLRKQGTGRDHRAEFPIAHTPAFSTPARAYYEATDFKKPPNDVMRDAAQAQDAFSLAISLLALERRRLSRRGSNGLSMNIKNSYESVIRNSGSQTIANDTMLHEIKNLKRIIDNETESLISQLNSSPQKSDESARIKLLGEIAKLALDGGLPIVKSYTKRPLSMREQLNELVKTPAYAKFHPPALLS